MPRSVLSPSPRGPQSPGAVSQSSWRSRTFSRMTPGGVRSSIFTLLSTALGIGVLTLPFAIARVGLILGLCLLVVNGLLGTLTTLILVVAVKMKSAKSYSDLMGRVGGRGAQMLSDFSLFCYGMGCVITFLVVFGDFTSKLTEAADFPAVLKNKSLLIGIGAFACAPLSLPEKLSALRYAALIPVAVLSGLAIVMTCRFFVVGSERVEEGGAGPPGTLPMFFVDWDVFRANSIFLFAFMQHQNVCPVADEMVNPTDPRIMKVCVRSLLAELALYIPIGVFTFLSFGEGTKGDFINNLHPDDSFTSIACRLLLTLSVPVCCAVCVISTVTSLRSALGPRRSYSLSRLDTGVSGDISLPRDSSSVGEFPEGWTGGSEQRPFSSVPALFPSSAVIAEASSGMGGDRDRGASSGWGGRGNHPERPLLYRTDSVSQGGVQHLSSQRSKEDTNQYGGAQHQQDLPPLALVEADGGTALKSDSATADGEGARSVEAEEPLSPNSQQSQTACVGGDGHGHGEERTGRGRGPHSHRGDVSTTHHHHLHHQPRRNTSAESEGVVVEAVSAREVFHLTETEQSECEGERKRRRPAPIDTESSQGVGEESEGLNVGEEAGREFAEAGGTQGSGGGEDHVQYEIGAATREFVKVEKGREGKFPLSILSARTVDTGGNGLHLSSHSSAGAVPTDTGGGERESLASASAAALPPAASASSEQRPSLSAAADDGGVPPLPLTPPRDSLVASERSTGELDHLAKSGRLAGRAVLLPMCSEGRRGGDGEGSMRRPSRSLSPDRPIAEVCTPIPFSLTHHPAAERTTAEEKGDTPVPGRRRRNSAESYGLVSKDRERDKDQLPPPVPGTTPAPPLRGMQARASFSSNPSSPSAHMAGAISASFRTSQVSALGPLLNDSHPHLPLVPPPTRRPRPSRLRLSMHHAAAAEGRRSSPAHGEDGSTGAQPGPRNGKSPPQRRHAGVHDDPLQSQARDSFPFHRTEVRGPSASHGRDGVRRALLPPSVHRSASCPANDEGGGWGATGRGGHFRLCVDEDYIPAISAAAAEDDPAFSLSLSPSALQKRDPLLSRSFVSSPPVRGFSSDSFDAEGSAALSPLSGLMASSIIREDQRVGGWRRERLLPSRGARGSGSFVRGRPGDAHGVERCDRWETRWTLSLTVIAVSWLVAVNVTDVTDVVGLVGGLFATTLMLCFPLWLFVKVMRENVPAHASWAVIIFIGVNCVIGYFSTVILILQFAGVIASQSES
uniref:Amino acid transporter transmembrane domain-containing protein n=1 Tax=Chromera velia CCMP2878 TaxID=1169474 RepID=A0A0G4GQ76_9ALVE|eukprot:Cvel_716.t1-p1 / transcript=Cvel_716.t1 / gene=Cvel_716 / organism=Chromera_velia_CCMP2878 / gene_product=Vacuolar amino acid transporter 6, putative / transcript_product=Vacuolar amino acid transporter 6, putative / location=Cvel_scaffold22:103046-110049(-) / protein_length=1243 / sequence_SO=supercontig / SO=protein_coding / is_pseudo=false